MRLPAVSFAWFHRLSRRERVLALLVAGTVFVILNLLALNFLLDAYTNLTRQYAEEKQDVLRQTFLADSQPMWAQRNAWLQAKQPILTNRDRAGTALLEQVQALARTQQVLISSFQINKSSPNGRPPAGDATAQPVTLEIETKADWRETVHFLSALQQPENFLVFDAATLRTNPADPKQMMGTFLLAKWYAPKGK